MSESKKFTPGPWFNGQDGFNLGCGVVYARHANGNPKDVATIRGWGSEQQANSRLIASAPDLLEALEGVLRISDLWLPHEIEEQHGEEMYVLHMARNKMIAAVEKARGQQ